MRIEEFRGYNQHRSSEHIQIFFLIYYFLVEWDYLKRSIAPKKEEQIETKKSLKTTNAIIKRNDREARERVIITVPTMRRAAWGGAARPGDTGRGAGKPRSRAAAAVHTHYKSSRGSGHQQFCANGRHATNYYPSAAVRWRGKKEE